MGFLANASGVAAVYDSIFPLNYPVLVEPGSLTATTTWSSIRPYYLKGNVTVNGGATLTIEPGVVVKFAQGMYLGVNGTLNVQGTAGSKIYFTDYRDDTVGGDTNGDGSATSPAARWWQGIVTNNNGSASLNYCEIRYGG